MELETKSFPVLEFKAASDSSGAFEAIVAVFGNIDGGGDRILPGAFKQTLAERGLPPIYHSHDWAAGPIGTTLEAEEREKGLWIKGRLFLEINDPFVNRIHAGMKTTGPKEFSFTYRPKEVKFVEEDGDEIRELIHLTCYEVGPTLIGMNAETELISMNSALKQGSLADLGPWLKKNLKAGARFSGMDPELIQAAHDALLSAGANCGEKTQPDPLPGDSQQTIARKQRLTQLLTMTRHKEAV